MKKRSLWPLLLMGGFFYVVPGFMATASAASASSVNLTILGLFPGSSMQQRADSIAEIIRRSTPYSITAKTSRPGVGHIMAQANDVNTMAVTLSPTFLAHNVLRENAPAQLNKFQAAAVMPTSLKSILFYTRISVAINSIPELIAKKYPLKMIDGGGSAQVANAILFKEVYGINIYDIEKWGGKLHHSAGGPQSIPLMKEGQADAHLVYTGGSWALWEELNATHPIKILPVAESQAELAKAVKALPAFIRTYWDPKDSKLLTKPVPTLGFAEQLWVNPKMDNNIVYAITKAVSENRKALMSLEPNFADVLQDPVKMAMYTASDPLTPIHPGAARYYREQGWLK